MRGLSASAATAAAVLLLAGCGGSEKNNGTLPIGVGDESDPTVTMSSPTSEPSESSTEPSKQVTTAPPTQRAKVVIVVGTFGSSPAVQGLVAKYPLYFQALVTGSSDLIKTNFPAFFYADTAINVETAKSNGWVMRPPASVVVVGAAQQPTGVVRISLCRSQTSQYWNPKTNSWVVVAPHGTPQAIDMVRTGVGWTMYQMAKPMPKGINCSKVHYPA